jgi:hypothetical protein
MANMTTTTGANFIPEIWSDEVVATYKSNLVVANLVKGLNHNGKKGDTIHLPNPGRNSANSKVAGSDVTAIVDTAADISVLINKHYEYSMYIEDIAALQALNSMRKFYTDDAGYALSKQVDTDIITDMRTNGTGDIASITNWDTSILAAIETLNDNDAPMNGRSLIVSPSAYTALLATDRFTEQQFIGNGTAISTGKVGMIYGVDVFVSSNVGTGSDEKGILFQKDALCLATQQSVRTQTQYKQEKLADLFTADTVYGTKVVRPSSIVEMRSTV